MIASIGLAWARAAGHSDVVLAARPRGVLHVCHPRTGRAGPSVRPACRRRSRRLYPLEIPSSRVPVAAPLCRRCSARVRSWAGPGRAEQLPHEWTAAQAVAAAAAAATVAEYWEALAWALTATPRVRGAEFRDAYAAARARLAIGDDTGPVAFGRTVARRDRGIPSTWVQEDVDVEGRARAILAFEHATWLRSGAKDAAVRDLFGLSAPRYVQVLHAVLDSPAGFALDPVLVHRLRRIRDASRRARANAS